MSPGSSKPDYNYIRPGHAWFPVHQVLRNYQRKASYEHLMQAGLERPGLEPWRWSCYQINEASHCSIPSLAVNTFTSLTQDGLHLSLQVSLKPRTLLLFGWILFNALHDVWVTPVGGCCPPLFDLRWWDWEPRWVWAIMQVDWGLHLLWWLTTHMARLDIT